MGGEMAHFLFDTGPNRTRFDFFWRRQEKHFDEKVDVYDFGTTNVEGRELSRVVTRKKLLRKLCLHVECQI